MDKNVQYDRYMSPFLLEYKNEKYQSMFRNSRIKISSLEGFHLWIYIIYSCIMLGYSIFLLYKCFQFDKLSYKIISGVLFSFSVISPFIEIFLITWKKKILFCKGIFYIITLQISIFLQSSYSFEFSPSSLWGLRFNNKACFFGKYSFID